MRAGIIYTAEAGYGDGCIDLTDDIGHVAACIIIVACNICEGPAVSECSAKGMCCCAEYKACKVFIAYTFGCTCCCMSSCIVGYTVRCNDDGWICFGNSYLCFAACCII